mgnify:CR=1 FL=1
MKRFKILSASLALSFITSLAHADLKVFATVPEWGALAQTLGGDKVKVYTATTGLQDPHRIQARPSLIANARSANLILFSALILIVVASTLLLDPPLYSPQTAAAAAPTGRTSTAAWNPECSTGTWWIWSGCCCSRWSTC